MIVHETQIYSSGCGLACVAILSGASQPEVADVIFGDGRTRNFYTEWPQLKTALTHFKVSFDETGARRVAEWAKIKTLAIVACGGRASDSTHHWVIYDPIDDLVYDPLKPLPVNSGKMRRKPFSYLPIEAIPMRID